MQTSRTANILRANFLLAIVGGLFALWGMTDVTSEEHNALFLGFSIPRLAILSIIILSLLIFSLLFYWSLQERCWKIAVLEYIDACLRRKEIVVLARVMIVVNYIVLFTPDQHLGTLASYRARLYPLIWWLAILSLQFVLTALLWRRPYIARMKQFRKDLVGAVILFGTLIVIVAMINWSRIGLKADEAFWQDAGVPLLIWQVFLAWGIGSFLYLLVGTQPDFKWKTGFRFLNKNSLDLYICLVLWIAAFALWTSYPLKPSYNALPPRAPNFESYPFGDAIIFDVNAQNYLIGIPIPNDFWQKPFYSFFLSILHILAGQNYDLLIQYQVGILAFIPVIVFLLTRILSNQAAGVIAASLVIIREINALSLSNVIQLSHSRLLMSDVFAMGLMTLIILLLTIWLKNPSKYRMLPIVVGGTMGILTLTRGHTLLLLPFVVLATVLVLVPAHQYRRLLEGIIVLLIGFSVPLGAWVWRNYQWTGTLTLQDPISPYTTQIARFYSLAPLQDPARLPGEDDVTYYTRIQKQPVTFTLEYPEKVISFVSAHYVHNMIFSFIYLPNSLIIENPADYVKRMPFWANWDGYLPTEAKIFLVINLFMLSLGISALWNQSGYLTSIPLLLGFGYNLSVSVGRLSGWRLIMPADWITLIFYSVGLTQISMIIYTFFSGKLAARRTSVISVSNGDLTPPWNWGKFGLLCLVLVGLSLGLTMGHTLFPRKYPEKTSQELLLDFSGLLPEKGLPFQEKELHRFLAQDGAVVAYGRGLYPSYLPSHKGELNYFYLAFAPRQYKRLVFQLIGPEESGVVLPLNSRPSFFPDAADVIVFGCIVDNEYNIRLPGYIDALLVAVETSIPKIYVRAPVPDLKCPFPEP